MLSTPCIPNEINNLVGRRRDMGRKKIKEGREMLINPVMTSAREINNIRIRLSFHPSYVLGITLPIFSPRFRMLTTC